MLFFKIFCKEMTVGIILILTTMSQIYCLTNVIKTAFKFRMIIRDDDMRHRSSDR